MKISHLNNSYEVSDIDLMNDEHCRELGRVVAEKCVVLVRQKISEKRLHEIQMLWGQPSSSIIDRYVGARKLGGRHWRSLLINFSLTTQAHPELQGRRGLARVSYEKDKKGRPRGFFTNGELDWHCDQQAYYDTQTVVGLMSLWGTKNSQTSFLSTAEAYDNLSADDRTMVDELVSVWAWDGGSMSRDLIDGQKDIVHYLMCPVPGMECPLVNETAAGVPGIRFPSHSFSHFRGMSIEESVKYRGHLWSLLDQDKYKYVHDWSDGEVIFMDQNITLHARPTNVKDGDKRTMARMISYMDHLYPEKAPVDFVLCDGKRYDHDTFAKMVDDQRRKEYYAEQAA